MITLRLVLLLLAFIVFAMAALQVPSTRINLIGLGLTLLTLVQLTS